MRAEDRTEGAPLPAGAFSTWLGGMRRALDGAAPSDVPCGGCTGCCRSSQFVHIGPEETGTLAHIPRALLFPAPRMPAGNVLLGYDRNGHCPMLVDDRCSIYEHRPRTCRTYDCRVFPAAGLAVDDDKEKLPIAQRARRWRFDFPEDDDHVRHAAVRAAAAFVEERMGVTDATQRAMLAVRLNDAFLGTDEPAPETIRALLT